MADIEAIATTYVEDASSTVIQFGAAGDLLPTDYKHLQIRISGKTIGTTYNDRIQVQFAYGSTPTFITSGYSFYYMIGALTAKTAGTGLSQAAINFYYLTPSIPAKYKTVEYSTHVMDIRDYQNGSKNTTATMTTCATPAQTSVSGVCYGSGMVDDVRAVTAIKLSSVYAYWSRGTEVTLYGLKG